MFEFGMKRGNQQVPPSRYNYITQLRRRLRFAHKKAKQVADRQQARHKGLYDRSYKGAALDIGDLVLVKKTAWKGRHKIQDRWESDEYQVIGQPNPGIPVCEVQNVAGGRSRVLHQNLLLPLQGRVRQQGGQEVEDPQGPEEEEEEEESGLPGVPKAPQVKTGKRHVSPQAMPTQHMEASSQDASADLKSKDSSDFRLLPESLLSEDSSEEDEVYTDSLTSHTTASDCTIGTLTSSLGPISSRVEEPNTASKTESQFSSSMPYLEDSTPLVDNNSTPLIVNSRDSHASADIVFVSDSSDDVSSPISSPVTPHSKKKYQGYQRETP